MTVILQLKQEKAATALKNDEPHEAQLAGGRKNAARHCHIATGNNDCPGYDCHGRQIICFTSICYLSLTEFSPENNSASIAVSVLLPRFLYVFQYRENYGRNTYVFFSQNRLQNACLQQFKAPPATCSPSNVTPLAASGRCFFASFVERKEAVPRHYWQFRIANTTRPVAGTQRPTSTALYAAPVNLARIFRSLNIRGRIRQRGRPSGVDSSRIIRVRPIDKGINCVTHVANIIMEYIKIIRLPY